MTPSPDQFPHSPAGWTPEAAMSIASDESLSLTEDHWEAVRAIQSYLYSHEDNEINIRELVDALDEKFHYKGGLRYLYQLLPEGPVAQGCRLAGYPSPPGSIDRGFGSVQ